MSFQNAVFAAICVVTFIALGAMAMRVERLADKIDPATFQAPPGCMFLEQKAGQLYQLYCNVPLTATLTPMLPAPPAPAPEKKP